MRRWICAGLTALAVVLGTAGTASASSGHVNEPWVRFPQAPFDRPAGTACDFAIHADIVEDEVMTKVVERYPDGSVKEQVATGKLIVRVSNVSTGANTLADASGSALFVFAKDGTITWYVIGPVIAAFRDGQSNIPRGLWTIDGVYIITFRTDGFRQVDQIHTTLHDVCADID
jgi:hypothetical protein